MDLYSQGLINFFSKTHDVDLTLRRIRALGKIRDSYDDYGMVVRNQEEIIKHSLALDMTGYVKKNCDKLADLGLYSHWQIFGCYCLAKARGGIRFHFFPRYHDDSIEFEIFDAYMSGLEAFNYHGRVYQSDAAYKKGLLAKCIFENDESKDYFQEVISINDNIDLVEQSRFLKSTLIN